ncbi:hypothetical protein C7446_2583 [Kushneria sinocarnis]|uniref:Uncharacterized protein n=1 Tax=Kushneria sinocarnis TaxID=595502 RepID=A0A420WUQ1_9GAMM|nr:hypothetical protein [Kushneria sinocarnis]RKQ97163.1 hypothetical protein C7446_2583 [Kushneria sinocarnis]
MATYGALFENASGDVLIDGSNPCCFLHETGDVTFTSYRDGDSGQSLYWYRAHQINFQNTITTHEPPFICGYSVKGCVIFGYVVGSPGNWQGFKVCASNRYTGYGNFGFVESIEGRIKYAVFSQNGEVRSSDDYGLLIRNEGGQQVFDSRKFPFSLQGQFSYRRWGDNDGSTVRYDGGFYNNGEDVEPPDSNSWPLLSTLNQMLWLRSPDFGALGKIIVEKNGDRFNYRLGLFYGVNQDLHSEFNGYNDRGGRATPNYDTLPNLGGGQTAYNLIVFGKIPYFIQ